MDTASLGGLCYLAGQVVSECDVGHGSPRGSKRPLEEALTALRKGALLLKHGRHGKPKVHFFRVCGADTQLKWRSASGSVKQVKLRNVSEVVAGQATEVFRRYPLREGAGSFSLRYRAEDGTSRTLDLTATDEQQFELWFTGLRVVAARLQALGTPVAALPPSGPGGLSPAELARCVGIRMQEASGPVCVPVPERTPCDLLAWGSAQRAPPVSMSLRSVMGVVEDCWQHRSLPGLAPGGGHLDVYRAAVGRKHAALVTATGAVYCWGEGRGGKLGLGHDQDQAQPLRIRHGLQGQCAVAVACGDDCTAALTDGGELFMWGRLHVDSRPQLVPLQVRGDLRGRKVVQVSCGPFHCAAVSSDGQLFTWGEGFGGKLGHGDQANRAHPSLVHALAGRQVLEVACGVWHSAAIVSEPEGSPYAPLALAAAAHHSPLKAESSAEGASAGGGGEGAGAPPASPAHLPAAAHHHRNNSTSSAFSEASVFHDGVSGALYTWGAVSESVAFGASEKRDSNKGCLGHGDGDLYRGQLLPTRVGGALEARQVRHVAAGSHLTVAVTTGGRVFQMGATGASGPARHCPWEGATLPELVRGALQGYFVDELCCGMHHAAATGRPLDRKLGRPADHAPRAAFAWGRGSEGQLGVKGFDDSTAPVLVEGLKGRHVLQVACGGSNSLAVCEHDVRRWEPDSKEEAEAASRALYALASEPRQARGQGQGQGEGEAAAAGGPAGRSDSRRASERASMGIVRRSFSMIGTRSQSISGGSGGGGGGGGAIGGPPDLARLSSGSGRSVHSLGGASAAGSARGGGVAAAHHPSFTQTYSFMAAHGPRSSLQHQQAHAAALPQPPKLQRMRSDRTTGSAVSAGTAGTAMQRIVSIGSPVKSAAHSHSGGSHAARRSTYAGGFGGPGGGAGMVSARSFTAGMGGYGGYAGGGAPSDMSSLSSWQHRPLSEDGVGGVENEADSGGGGALAGGNRRVSSADLAAALDDMRSGSSSLALQEELAEKNRIIDRLQRTLDKMQRQQQQQAAQQAQQAQQGGGPSTAPRAASAAADAEKQLREAVRASAGAFREAQLGGGSPPQQQRSEGSSGGRPRVASSPAAAGSWHSPLRSSLSPRAQCASPAASAGAGAAEEQHAELAAMEALLAKKEAHLEGQQAQLAAWAAELQRREVALAWQQAALVGAGGRPVGVTWAPAPGGSPTSAGAVPEPIPSESPTLSGRALAPAPAAAALPRAAPPAAAPAAPPRALAAAAAAPASLAAHPVAASSTGSASGTQPGSPAAADEWTEEFEEGVFLTFTSEAGAKKLRRIRFNRSLFSATSAKQWYEVNKHRLAQPTGTPRVAGGAPTPPAPAAAAAAADGTGTAGGSRPGTPLALPAGPPPPVQGPEEGRGQKGQAANGAAHLAASEAEAQAVAGLLHYRQTSRNLSFDARELAAFNERLQQALAPPSQQQHAGQGGGGGGAAAGLPLPHRPASRLSKPPLAGLAAGSEAAGSGQASPFAAAATPRRQEPGEAAGGAAAASPLLSPSPGLGGEASREWKSAHSSPFTADSSHAASREASVTPGEQGGIRRGSYSASGGSSPIRAGSRSGSPLSKHHSVASSSLAKQLSSSVSELAKYTPRAVAAGDPQPQQATGAGVSERSASGGSQATASPDAASDGKRSPSGFSAKMSRIRRSLTGGGGGSGKKA